jgi:pilus assembly protein FimV
LLKKIRALVPAPEIEESSAGGTSPFGSLEDTFSSDTAVNLDQADPLAEADFHMAYGLYDQAADLINDALESDPGDKTLMSKLCEIYFVWGNQDAFVDAATRLKVAIGAGDSSDWDKIVIMGQQIAGDHELFAGAGVAGATRAVDLSFESEMDEAPELDMDFGEDATAAADVIDLGALQEVSEEDGVDFLFDAPEGEEAAETAVDLEETAETTEIEAAETDETVEIQEGESTAETPTIEQQFSGMEGTSELPSLDDEIEDVISDSGEDIAATAEINLDELDLDLTGTDQELEDTGLNEVFEDSSATMGKNLEVDPESTGVDFDIDLEGTGIGDALDLGDIESTGMRLAPDETGVRPGLSAEDEIDSSLNIDLLDATGHTQILSEGMGVETAADLDVDIDDVDKTLLAGFDDEATEVTSDAATMLAPMDEDEDDFEFSKTEALPAEIFADDSNRDDTTEMPVVAGTDVDLDLDDLTAALQSSDVGDTIEQLHDDATVEQARPGLVDETAELPALSIDADDMSDDLQEARTMTEVGTKLDLARAYVDMGDPAGARSILEEVLDEGDEGQRQQAQHLLDSLPS